MIIPALFSRFRSYKGLTKLLALTIRNQLSFGSYMIRINYPKIVRYLVFLVLVLVGSGSHLVAQDGSESTPDTVPKAELIDEFGRVGNCDLSARMDYLFMALSKRPDHQGYIINYQGVNTLPGDREKFSRERALTNQISFRAFDESRITFLRGGYRQDVMTELWLVPPSAAAPEPSQTVPEPKPPVGRTFLFTKSGFWTDDISDPLDEFVLAIVKEREEAERRTQEEEVQQGDGGEVADISEERSIEEPPLAKSVDDRSPEEKEEERFQWANVGIARMLAERKNDTGVIIFYADDLRYDIAKLRTFILQGRNLLAEHGPIKASRVRVQFGGYRHNPEVEFWVVPQKGKRPVATPDERPVEEEELDQN
jgi:hypothetical protein